MCSPNVPYPLEMESHHGVATLLDGCAATPCSGLLGQRRCIFDLSKGRVSGRFHASALRTWPVSREIQPPVVALQAVGGQFRESQY